MLEKSIVALLLFVAVAVADGKHIAKMGAKAAISYSFFILLSGYLAFAFMSGRALYNLTDIMQSIYGPMAVSVVGWLKG